MGMVASVRWAAVAQGARVVAQLISTAVLARLLPPSAYGLMAMAMTVTNLVFLFRDLGTSVAIIQRGELSESMVCTVHWLNVGMGIASAVLLCAGAHPLALVFGAPQLEWMIVLLASVFPIAGIGLVHQALMERNSRFRDLARIEAISAFGGLIVAICLAAAGAGIWSLVCQMVFSTLLSTVQLVMTSPWKSRLIFVKKDLVEIMQTGTDMTLFRLFIYLEQNIDSIVIGRLIGSSALGIYSMAYKVMLLPLQNLTAVASRTLLPALSRNQHALRTMGILYLRSVSLVCVVTAPMMAGAFILREELVVILFGPRWAEVAELLKWLAPVGFIQSVTTGTGVVFMALGKSRQMLKLGMFGAVLQVGAFLLGVRWGIEGVAASYLIANILNFLPCFFMANRLLKITLVDALQALAKPIGSACFMLLVLYVLVPSIDAVGLHLLNGFVLKVLIGASAYVFALFVLMRQSMVDILALARFS